MGFSHRTHCLVLLSVTFWKLLESARVDLTGLEGSSPCSGHALPLNWNLRLTAADLKRTVWAEGKQEVAE